TLPFHATSSGQVVLAFQPESFCETILALPLPRLTAHTVTDPATLRSRLSAIRTQGLAESTGGFEADVHSLAVPLFDTLGRCTGGLAVAAPKGRMTETLRTHIRAALTRAGQDITSLWGGQLPPALAALWHAAA
ncbi:MAG: IclR family transcriptional regulator C-terminal domain-containing protein, partial [Rhodobacteraceae bacterium]|nr:IclR family transcriptional regulator C-terminal domain-containing protein [Paracoccaceae bacterium]